MTHGTFYVYFIKIFMRLLLAIKGCRIWFITFIYFTLYIGGWVKKDKNFHPLYISLKNDQLLEQ